MLLLPSAEKPFGVHYFTGNHQSVDPSHARILHFESCDLSMWIQKFSEGSFSESVFPFYRQSWQVVQDHVPCKTSTCMADLEQMYRNSTGPRPQEQLTTYTVYPPRRIT